MEVFGVEIFVIALEIIIRVCIEEPSLRSLLLSSFVVEQLIRDIKVEGLLLLLLLLLHHPVGVLVEWVEIGELLLSVAVG